MSRLRALKDKRLIKIITGIRRCGKSTLLLMFRNELMAEGVEESQIIHLNFEDYDNYDLREPSALHKYVKERLIPHKRTYLMFDEIQNVRDFPEIINSFFLNDDIDIYLIGSNAYMLSSDIATVISGRYIEIRMLPLSFKEFTFGLNLESNPDAAYQRYLEWSSFPYTTELDDYKTLYEYLDGLYSTIVLKDISQRYRFSDIMAFQSVIRYCADNIGNICSTKRIADCLSAQGRKVDVKTVEKYLSALKESFLLMQVQRFDIKGREFLKTLEKYYIVDIGLRNMLLSRKNYDSGRILENVVYLALKSTGREVFIGKWEQNEVDFVVKTDTGFEYYQIAASVRDASTLERELKSLKNISDSYPKYLLTLDREPRADYDGIIRMNVLDWMLSI